MNIKTCKVGSGLIGTFQLNCRCDWQPATIRIYVFDLRSSYNKVYNVRDYAEGATADEQNLSELFLVEES